MILVFMGFKAALAAEMVSFWICISVALFDFLSPNIVFPDDDDDVVVVIGCCEADTVADGEAAAVVDPDVAGGTAPGSAVIRSINVVPDNESYNI